MSNYVTEADNNFRTALGATIFRSKYALTPDETWKQRAETIVDDVCGTRSNTTHPLMSKEERKELTRFIHLFKFLPGGRYIYYAGRPSHFYNNCFLFKPETDTRESWGILLHSSSDALMCGGGVGIDYSPLRGRGSLLKKSGGVSSGPLHLAFSINETGRNVQQGGSRRSALLGSLNWQHPDVNEWLYVKDWANTILPGTNITYAEAKHNDFDAFAPLDSTNITINYDDALFSNENWNGEVVPSTFLENTRMAMRTGEPGFAFNLGAKGEETLRNPCVTGDTRILTKEGYFPIVDLVGKTVDIWNGEGWASVTPFETGWSTIMEVKLSDGTSLRCTPNHKFVTIGLSGTNLSTPEFVEAQDLQIGEKIAKFEMPVLEGGIDEPGAPDAYSQGFYSADGTRNHTWSPICFPKYPCISRLTGVITDSKGKLAHVQKNWNHGHMKPKNWVPLNSSLEYRLNWLAGVLDGDGSIIRAKNSDGIQLYSVEKEFLLNVRLLLTTLGVTATIMKTREAGIRSLYYGKNSPTNSVCKASRSLLIGGNALVKLMKLGIIFNRLKVSCSRLPLQVNQRFVKVISVRDCPLFEPTYCFTEPKTHRGTFEGIVTGNCGEAVSDTNNDICCLGSVNMAACSSIEEFKTAVELGSKFLICGTIRGDVPNEAIRLVREKNRRIGLGLMGMHEWALQRGYKYEVNDELKKWLSIYSTAGEAAARAHCDRFFINHPVAYRAIAPNGTIGTMAGTTTGIEPIYAVAYKRRYIDGDRNNGVETRRFQYCIDEAAKGLIKTYGLVPDEIETAIVMAKTPERRIAFQADVQAYVDQAISSTMNLPPWDSEDNNESLVEGFARTILKYAPRLRGLTFYPDGARGGQPLVPVPYQEALDIGEGLVFEENSDTACKSGVCGI